MKKKIIGLLILAALVGVVLIGVLPASAAPGVLDHVQITPTSATVPVGGPVQFLAQSYDDSNNVVSGVTYQWSVSGGGTIIPATGLFTATTNGTYNVQVTATQVGVIKTATATVKVTNNTTVTPSTNLQIGKLCGMFGPYLNSIGFSNFLGSQWQVKNGNGVDTIQAVPGVVQEISGANLKVLPNGQSTAIVYDTTNATILPKNTTLAVNDNVVVILKNSQVIAVVKVTARSTTGQEPPGFQKHDKDRDSDKNIPPGWSKGNKNGWNNNSDNDDDED